MRQENPYILDKHRYLVVEAWENGEQVEVGGSGSQPGD